jgi:hypothetical protein
MDKPICVCKQKHENQTTSTLGKLWKSCEIIAGDAIFMAGTVLYCPPRPQSEKSVPHIPANVFGGRQWAFATPYPKTKIGKSCTLFDVY